MTWLVKGAGTNALVVVAVALTAGTKPTDPMLEVVREFAYFSQAALARTPTTASRIAQMTAIMIRRQVKNDANRCNALPAGDVGGISGGAVELDAAGFCFGNFSFFVASFFETLLL
jgi:hypothetical protein